MKLLIDAVAAALCLNIVCTAVLAHTEINQGGTYGAFQLLRDTFLAAFTCVYIWRRRS